MTTEYVQAVELSYDNIRIKFVKTIALSSIVNEHFVLTDPSNAVVSPAFRTIDVEDDYNTVSRELDLYFASTLNVDDTYHLKLTGLQDVSMADLPDLVIDFTSIVPIVPDLATPPTAPSVDVIDHSIQSRAFITADTLLTFANSAFYVVSTDPDNDDVFVDNAYHNGRIAITFSRAPNVSFLTSRYFRCQRKLISKAASRWETIDARISIDNEDPIVYVDIPSIDATPVYTAAGSIYFEEGYKYRVNISKDVGA